MRLKWHFFWRNRPVFTSFYYGKKTQFDLHSEKWRQPPTFSKQIKREEKKTYPYPLISFRSSLQVLMAHCARHPSPHDALSTAHAGTVLIHRSALSAQSLTPKRTCPFSLSRTCDALSGLALHLFPSQRTAENVIYFPTPDWRLAKSGFRTLYPCLRSFFFSFLFFF